MFLAQDWRIIIKSPENQTTFTQWTSRDGQWFCGMRGHVGSLDFQILLIDLSGQELTYEVFPKWANLTSTATEVSRVPIHIARKFESRFPILRTMPFAYSPNTCGWLLNFPKEWLSHSILKPKDEPKRDHEKLRLKLLRLFSSSMF